MARTLTLLLLLVSSIILFLCGESRFHGQVVAAERPVEEDKLALLDFLLTTPHSRFLNWSPDIPVCESWTGVSCSEDQSRVVSLRLPGIGFQGPIPANTLTRLSGITVLSLRFNSFSGRLSSDFSVWPNLTVLDLSNNGFNGSIPRSLSRLTRIRVLNLANNSLSGEIPDIDLPSLKWINLSYNNLTGAVPESFRRFPSWAFTGNNLSSEAANPRHSRTKRLGEPTLLGVALGACTFGFAVISVSMVTCCSSHGVDDDTAAELEPSSAKKKGGSSGEKRISGRSKKEGRIVSLDGTRFPYRFRDLLKFPAEVLGKGTFGSTYKLALKDGNEVAVKWVAELSDMDTKFEQLMELVGGLRHENIAPLKAYYCSSDAKLLIYDYYREGSVSSVLHGKAADRKRLLSWGGRLKVALGAARGLGHIHIQGRGQHGKKLVHGNMKASNIFFNTQGFGCISDIGLTTLMNPTLPASLQGLGYRAPEMTDARNASQETDVYSFGVLLLELLTGKSPKQSAQSHLVRWVQSVVREEWSSEVFDLDLLTRPGIEDEMIEMLRIGMACVSRMPEERPKMPVVVEMVEAVYQARSIDQLSANQESSFQVKPARR
ncbi:hypothetical protein SAY86_011452 [Trapa natans]|uniref:Protein kinase domain-containing protein n=1 Tax=Trapa natans TaxID=22666 RepID=A0AAN7LN88_TRANT|nr:hypothetical protein SAY86_011452 [Trapa natans]